MKNRIYIKDWLELKPYDKQTATDSYYLKICNDVNKAIRISKLTLVLNLYLDSKKINILSCFLTSYFEDLISETNIWNSFIRIHQRLYKKQLPFYNLDGYYEEEINTQDVSFLIWYFLNMAHEDIFIAPYNDFIEEIAEKVMDVFDKAWEYAPENKYLKSFYQIAENEDNFYVARHLIETILFRSYLFYPDTSLKLLEQELEIIENNKDDENVIMLLNDNLDNLVHNTHTRLLSLKGKEWASEILGKNHRLSKDFSNISPKIIGFFFYKGQDDDYIFIEHIASSKKFNLLKKSFDYSDTLIEVDTIMFLGGVKWKNEWWFSGIFFQIPYNPNIIKEEKSSLESRKVVDFLDHQKFDTNKNLRMQLAAFKDFNNGSQIAFLPSEELENFYSEFVKFFNKSLDLSKKKIKEAKQREKDDGYFGTPDNHNDFSEVSETGLVFFNHNSGGEIALDVNSAFPMSSNPYYEEENSEEHIMTLLMDDSLSTELAMFCIDNCKHKLPFFNNGIGEKYLDNIDFLLRFWKKDNYHTKPSITYTGQDK